MKKSLIILMILCTTYFMYGCNSDINKKALTDTTDDNADVPSILLDGVNDIVDAVTQSIDNIASNFDKDWCFNDDYRYYQAKDSDDVVFFENDNDNILVYMNWYTPLLVLNPNNYVKEDDGNYRYKDAGNVEGDYELIYCPDSESIFICDEARRFEYTTIDYSLFCYYVYSKNPSINNSNTSNTDNNNISNDDTSVSDSDVYAAARRFMYDAIDDTTYSKYDWSYVRDAGVSHSGNSYTATFYVYSGSLKSYKYLRVNMLYIDGSFTFSNGSM